MVIENTPYAQWLEESVKNILDFRPDAMCLVATRQSDGLALTGYYNSGPREMSSFLHHVGSDLIMEVIENNIAHIKGMMEEEDDDDE